MSAVCKSEFAEYNANIAIICMRVCFGQIIELEWTERHCHTKKGPAGVADDMLLKFAMDFVFRDENAKSDKI